MLLVRPLQINFLFPVTRDDSLSLSNFYKRIIRDHDCLPEEHELKEARVGRSKENLDSVDDLGEDLFCSCKY